jgi:hypothetical protein
MPRPLFDIEGELEFIVMDNLIKGKIIKALPTFEDEEKEIVHYDINNLRKLVAKINTLYENKAPREEFIKVITEMRKANCTELCNMLETKEFYQGDPFLKVIDRKDSGDKITVTFQKVNSQEKNMIVKSIAEKLVKQMTPEQVKVMLQEGIRKCNDIDSLKKVDKSLDTEAPQIEGKRGCFKLIIGGEDLHIID